MSRLKLYGYWRSTTSYRVRAALNLKGVSYETIPVDLVAGDQREEGYLKLNPGSGVPTLVLEDGTNLTQSQAILEYIDTVWPEPQLIPADPLQRAKVQAVAHAVALDIHPVNNLRVIGELKSRFHASPEDCQAWMCHWMAKGFAAIEKVLPASGLFAFGEQLTIADICITAQAYNAHRWGLDLGDYPAITRIEQACLELPAIHAAHPDQQPEANQ